MKRLFLFVVLLFIIIGCIYDGNCTYEVGEEIVPIRDELGNTIGENVIITIPDNYNSEYIYLSPSIMDGFIHYRGKDDFIVKISINNNSKYTYSYVSNSFSINTSVPNDVNNYLSLGVGFDGLNIYDSYYRTYNDALVSLVDNLELSDENINNSLINIGYKGISELNVYYLDYYGDDYINYIFYGDSSIYKESNITLIEDAYNYFFNNIIFINDYSLYSYINNNRVIDNIDLFHINYYFNSAFSNYLFNIKFHLKLKRVHSKNF